MERRHNVSLLQGDIVLVPFPFTDLSSMKTRPALVISKAMHGDDVIVCAVTSKSFRGGVRFTALDLVAGRLPVVSFVRPEKVVALHYSLVRQVVARLDKKKLVEVINQFKSQF